MIFYTDKNQKNKSEEIQYIYSGISQHAEVQISHSSLNLQVLNTMIFEFKSRLKTQWERICF